MLEYSTKIRKSFVSKSPSVFYVHLPLFILCSIMLFSKTETTSLFQNSIFIAINLFFLYSVYKGSYKKWLFFEKIKLENNEFKFTIASHSDINIRNEFEGNILELYLTVESNNKRFIDPFHICICHQGKQYFIFQDDKYWTEEKLIEIIKFIYKYNPKLVNLKIKKEYILKQINS